MENHLLNRNLPEDLKHMNEKQLELLSYEIRDFLLEKLTKTGGHVASNLGVVELSIALHTVFDSPKDKIIWDVGHQSYVHKILTGRANQFDGLRSLGGLSGFPKREESPHDMFDSGHSSNSISAAMGYAAARDLNGEDYSVISVIGDGALTGGMAYEGLNNAGSVKSKMIVILNDNEMSISKNIGGMSQHLSKLRTSHGYLEFKKQLKKALKGIPAVGEGLYSSLEHLRDSVKYALVQGAIFEELGFDYIGPIDGHNIHDLLEVLRIAKVMEEPVLIHILTQKGKGYKNAEANPAKFHGIGPFDAETGSLLSASQNMTYSGVFGNKLVQLAAENPKIVAVSAAMIDGTGLKKFSDQFPNRIFDAGIAEAHAVTFSAGLALSGFRPVVAIYSTFLQRAYDQILIDVCMQKLPVIFAVDRGGIVGADGETHHGIFDFSYLGHMPGMTVLAPKDGKELAQMLEYAMTLEGPCALRYPRGEATNNCSRNSLQVPLSKGMEILREGDDVTLLTVGSMTSIGLDACEKLRLYGIDAGLVNARFVAPLDEKGLLSLAGSSRFIVTLEDNVLSGGFGAQVERFFCEHCSGGEKRTQTLAMGWPDKFIEHGSIGQLLKKYHLDAEGIAERVCEFIERKA